MKARHRSPTSASSHRAMTVWSSAVGDTASPTLDILEVLVLALVVLIDQDVVAVQPQDIRRVTLDPVDGSWVVLRHANSVLAVTVDVSCERSVGSVRLFQHRAQSPITRGLRDPVRSDVPSCGASRRRGVQCQALGEDGAEWAGEDVAELGDGRVGEPRVSRTAEPTARVTRGYWQRPAAARSRPAGSARFVTTVAATARPA
jgi:hypothetical protein